MKSKHIYKLVILTILVLFCSSCENNPVRNSIAGGTFYGKDSSGEMQIYFAKNGTCHLVAYVTTTQQALNTSSLVYKVVDNTVIICCDNSNAWIDSAKGKTLFTFLYNSAGDYLYSMDAKLYRQ